MTKEQFDSYYSHIIKEGNKIQDMTVSLENYFKKNPTDFSVLDKIIRLKEISVKLIDAKINLLNIFEFNN